MTAWRLAVRLARRDVRRRPWRSVLVILMVLLPTGSMTVVATYIRTGEQSPTDRLSAEVGRADLVAYPQELRTDASVHPDTMPASAAPVVPAEPVPPRELVQPRTSVSEAELRALERALPQGSRVVVEHRSDDRVRDGDERAYFVVSDVDLDDPIVDGRFLDLEGRAPRDASEAVVSDEVAESLDLEIGEQFRPERLGERLTVVGTLRARSWPDALVITPAPQPETARQVHVWVDTPGERAVLGHDAHVGRGEIVTGIGDPAGWTLSPMYVSWTDDRDEEIFWTYVGGGVALAVLGTVIAAAFAIGARRQLRTLGLLSASGASPTTLRWLLVAQGAFLGAVGAVTGVGVGVLVARVTPHAWLESIAGHPVSGPVTPVADLVPILVIGTVASAAAAWFPARSIATVSTLQALAGRRPLGHVPARLPFLGAASVAGGCALFAMATAGARSGGSNLWALVAVAGGLACLFGAVAVAPWIVAWLERAAGRWPPSLRLAARSIGRSRVRSSAVIGAITAVCAALVAGSALYASFDDGDVDGEVPWLAESHVRVDSYAIDDATAEERPAAAPDDVVEQVLAIVGDATVVETEEVGGRDLRGSFTPAWAEFVDGDLPPELLHRMPQVGVAGDELLDLLDVPADLRRAIDRGAAASVVRPDGDDVEEVRIVVPGRANERRQTVELAGVVRSAQASLALPQVLISSATAERLGLERRPSSGVVIAADEPLTSTERDRLQLLAEDIAWEEYLDGDDVHVHLQGPSSPDDVAARAVRLAAMALGLVLVAAVVGIGLALAAKDGEDERHVLVAVGAAPRSLRRISAVRAGMLVAAAAVVAVPAGLLPAAAIVWSSDSGRADNRFAVDMWSVLFVLLVMPLAVAAGVAVASRARAFATPARPLAFSVAD